MEAEPELCGAFQLKKLLLCVRRTDIGVEHAGLYSVFCGNLRKVGLFFLHLVPLL